jgi:hypothetical protein
VVNQMVTEATLLIDKEGGFASFVPFAAPAPFNV